ncbi:LINE-1 retrotransposable element ORF2 protein [Trametes pubescens]|uniref:LINE-1 retrotransposable element ORF2 protein n=1 Tax=Trametes pubescens TaxID=154538 RepID=A0A1M2VNT9_TRAPU|nr:LINE-1 retrotransposable element ORF2 protein [Trametes pubescens]
MRGYGQAHGNEAHARWMLINQLVRDERIGILALQETHLDDARAAELTELFGRHVQIYHSPFEANPTGACGVAFVVNKRFVDAEMCALTVVQPGRAIVLDFPWVEGTVLRMLNVYAPNVMSENAKFWEDLATPQTGKIDVMLGDFNMVEDGIDRLPARVETERVTGALNELLQRHRLEDGWRVRNPCTKAYTYMQAATGAQSRIDRIYLPRALQREAEDWAHKESGIATDHKLAMTSLANHAAPFMGKGRWSLPTHLLSDDEMKKTMRRLGAKLIAGLEAATTRTSEKNPQTLYQDFKEALTRAARERAKARIPRLQKRLARLRVDLDTTLNPHVDAPVFPEGAETKQRHAALLQQRIDALEQKLFTGRRRMVASKHWVQSETMSKYWTRPNVAPLPSIAIPELHRTDRPEGGYTNNTRQMAEVARAHYDGLQNCDPIGQDEPHDEYIKEALIPSVIGLTNAQKADMARRLSREDVESAVCGAARNKAPGLDGLPSEVWKEYNRWQVADAKRGAPTLDMMAALTAVFNDIEEHGVITQSSFTEGWICPIYKLKKDMREIVNYRPITLLNSDYKLMTRALASKLAVHAPSIIHPDQAGFVPGRRIFDHIQMNKLIIEYAEAEEINGAIVALDQEKAYDCIDHYYLWKALEHANFPRNFIETIKTLYSNAVSCVMINGVRSATFRIWRGVRQGDPMSCLLFAVAIEPLACALRSSTLRGILIPGDTERLIANLFADDTTVFLGAGDDYSEAIATTSVWCRASRARFNLEKTEVIPVGTAEFRARVLATRKLRVDALPIPANVHIVQDGEAVRSLGAWIGNCVDNATPWTPLLNTMKRNLEHWEKARPTLHGRKLAVDLEVAGRTQFLAKAQGMPKDVENKLTRMVADFMWGGDRHPRVDRATLYAPVDKGGLSVLNVAARNEAIDLVRLQDYLNLSPTRPRWALVADALLSNAVAATSKNADPKARLNYFLQNWEVSTRKKAGLPLDLKRMVVAAKKFGAKCDVRVASRELRNAMPVWYHLGAEGGRSTAKSAASKCLRDNHGVSNVAQCVAMATRLRPENTEHRPSQLCECAECDEDRKNAQCANPHRCACAAERLLDKLQPKWNPFQTYHADALTLTPGRKRANDSARAQKERVVFDPSVTQTVPLAAVFRVFTSALETGTVTAVRPPRPFDVVCEEVEVYTDGSCIGNGTAAAIAGSGAWFGRNDHRNVGTRVPYDAQSNQSAEVYAVILAEQRVAPFAPLHLVSDSKYVVDGLTTHLRKWEERGWIGVTNAALFRDAAAALRARSAVTTLRWVKGHSRVEGNEQADALARAGTLELPQFRPVHLPKTKYVTNGAALSKMTQSLAYKGVKKRVVRVERTQTGRNLACITEAVEKVCRVSLLTQTIWLALRRDPVSRKIRDFIWKAIHGAHRVGKYWKHIPGYEERGTCGVCGQVDDMEHILTKCTAPGQREVWELAKELLRNKLQRTPEISLGLVLGSHVFVELDKDGAVMTAKTRAARIILMEATHLVWVLRCERVIAWEDAPDRQHSRVEIRRRFEARLNNRICMDLGGTNVRVHKKRALKCAVVRKTWEGLLQDERLLPENWINEPEVLVGMPPYPGLRDTG